MPILQIKRLLHSKWMPVGAGALGFLEGSIVVFPIEPLAVPAMLASRKRALTAALFLVAGNVLAAVLIYALGAWLSGPVIEPVLKMVGAMTEYREASAALRENGFSVLFMIGVTPFPFQVGTAAAGAAHLSFPVFVAAVALSRGLRYLALAGLVMAIGARAGDLIERREGAILAGGLALFVLFVIAAVVF